MSQATRTMTTPAIVPILSFRDGVRTVDWLCEAFGFARAMVMADGDVVQHCELTLGGAMVMGGSDRPDASPYKAFAHPPGRAMLYVGLEGGLEAHLERARAAGAEIVMELEEKEYGGADYTARDPEGNLWTFGTYVPQVPA